jgi:hypothetical protein
MEAAVVGVRGTVSLISLLSGEVGDFDAFAAVTGESGGIKSTIDCNTPRVEHSKSVPILYVSPITPA